MRVVHDDRDLGCRDAVVLSGMRDLANAFDLENTTLGDNSGRLTVKDLYNASSRTGSDKEILELYTFATTLRDGYILCQ